MWNRVKIQTLLKINCCTLLVSRNIARFFHFSLEIEFNALRFINYTIPRLCSTYAVATLVYHKTMKKLIKSFHYSIIPLLSSIVLLKYVFLDGKKNLNHFVFCVRKQ